MTASLLALLVGTGWAGPPGVETAVGGPANRQGDASDATLRPAAKRKPEGAPVVEVLFVAWSVDPLRRMASLRVDGGGSTIIREGRYVEGTMLKVLSILPDGVVFGFYAEAYRVPAKRH